MRHYTSRELRPAEVLILAQHRGALSGRVLELGPGGGRVTGYLVQLGADLLGVDVNPGMIAHAREAIPGAEFVEADLRDLSFVASGSRDSVMAADNVLDVTSWSERPRVLAELHRILVSGGKLVMSSHNRAADGHLRTPTQVRWDSPPRALVDLKRMPKRLWHRRRLLRYEQRDRDWAVLNDVSHDFRALHLYVTRQAQERQLSDAGFELLSCLDTNARPVGPGEDAPTHEELYYVAMRV